MEYNLSKHALSYCNKFLDTVNEQIVDVDITLPDYCPDIEKILKCTLIPKIFTNSISGGQLTIEGATCVRVLYCDSIKRNVRSYEQTVPFVANFNLKSTLEQYIVLTNTKCEYVNCRALSPRKLCIHGAFSLYAKVLCKDTTQLYDFEEDCDLQTKKQTLELSDLCAMCEHHFSISEDITISNKPPVQSLLTYNVSAQITELKSIHNKLMLTLDVMVRVMYLSDLDSGKTEHLYYVFPVSQIISCDGITDDCVNVPNLSVMSFDVFVRNDTLSDGSTISVDAKLCFSNMAYQSKNLDVLEDVYSTKYEINSKSNILSCDYRHILKDFTHISNVEINLQSIQIQEIIDVYAQNITLTPVLDNSTLTLDGKLTVCMLIKDTEDNINYIERTSDISLSVDVEDSFDKAMLNSSLVSSISFRLADENNIDLKVEIKSSVLLYNFKCTNQIVSITSEQELVCTDNDCAMCLYYADKGENLWDIAKDFKVRMDSLYNENELSDDILTNSQMLVLIND